MNEVQKAKFISFLLIITLTITSFSSVYAQSPQEILNKYIADLQSNPNDNALQEKIIKHVQTMKPTPVIPEDANRHFVTADTFQKTAKDVKGYELAISEYQQALLIAPWWPEAYNNLGILLEQAGRYNEAIISLKLYIATNPPDVRAAQNKIYQIEASERMATLEKKEEVEQKKGKSDFLFGRWRYQSRGEAERRMYHAEFHMDGETLIMEIVQDQDDGPIRTGHRFISRWYKVRDKVFQRKNEVSGLDCYLEFHDNYLIDGIIGGSKGYWERE